MPPFAEGDEVEVQEWNGEWVRGRVTSVDSCTSGSWIITARVPPIRPDKPETATIKREPARVRRVSLLELMAEAAK